MYNHVELIGRLTKDCEVAKTHSGQSVCNFALATSERRQIENGDWTDVATYIDCTAWRKSADFLGQFGKKGRLFHVVGKIRKNSYIDRDGIKRYVTNVEAITVNALDKLERVDKPVEEPSYPDIQIDEDELPW